MTEAASDQSKFESAIEGIVHTFCLWIHFSSPSKELLQTSNGKKDFWTNFTDSCNDINNIKERNTLGYLHKVRPYQMLVISMKWLESESLLTTEDVGFLTRIKGIYANQSLKEFNKK